MKVKDEERTGWVIFLKKVDVEHINVTIGLGHSQNTDPAGVFGDNGTPFGKSVRETTVSDIAISKDNAINSHIGVRVASIQRNYWF